MVHAPRKISETGYYHVVVKGDGGQILFECDADRMRFIANLLKATEEEKVEVHACCLMDNHVHLLVNDREFHLSAFMKKVDERYAMYFRKRTGRVGHLFQSRFWNEPIKSDEQYLATMRYIHANPEPARMCLAKDYKWSSYKAFLGKSKFVVTNVALSLLGGKQQFEDFHKNACKFVKPFPDSTLSRHLTYDELLYIAENLLGRETLLSLKAMKPPERKGYFVALNKAGFTDAQISRLTGIGQSSIHNALGR